MRYLTTVLILVSLTACTAQDLQTGDSAGGQSTSTVTTTSTPATVACDSATLPFGGGSGTSADPWLVCSSAQLINVGNGAYDHDSFKLMADISLMKLNAQNQVVATSNLGNFYGSLDGNGHFLAGLYTTTGHGLFDILYGTAKNLELRYMNVQCPDSDCGVFAGQVSSGATVDNVVVHDSQVSGYQNVGGVFGDVAGTATRAYVWTTTVTMGSLNGGGLVGRIEAGAVVSGNSASGSYNAGQQHGFVVGLLGGAVTCIAAPGHSWSAAGSIGINFGAGTNNGCP